MFVSRASQDKRAARSEAIATAALHRDAILDANLVGKQRPCWAAAESVDGRSGRATLWDRGRSAGPGSRGVPWVFYLCRLEAVTDIGRDGGRPHRSEVVVDNSCCGAATMACGDRAG